MATVKSFQLYKWLMGRNSVHRLISAIITLYLKLVYHTSRWEIEGEANRIAFLESGQAYIILAWHARIAMLQNFWDTSHWPLAVVVSRHRDGQVVTRIMQGYGLKSLEVSSKMRAHSGAKSVLRAIHSGMGIVLTSDGPRGPARTLKPSAIQMARLGGARLTMATYSVKRRIVLKSWDNFLLPLPFNRGVVIWNAGINVPKTLNEAEARALCLKAQTMMNDLTDRADRLMGHPADTDRKQRKKKR